MRSRPLSSLARQLLLRRENVAFHPPCGVLLVIPDVGRLDAMARRLRALGCRVYCVRSLDEAADLLKTGLVPDFLFALSPPGDESTENLRDELAARLPSWSIQIHVTEDDGDSSRRVQRRQRVPN